MARKNLDLLLIQRDVLKAHSYSLLGQRTPTGRKAATDTTARAMVISMPRLGGLHRRYDLAV